jgi:hypothetical protein
MAKAESQYKFFRDVNLNDGALSVAIVGGGGGGTSNQPYTFYALDYNDLQTKTGMVSGDIAYVQDSQGTQWLPGTSGGTYYAKGLYLYNGTTWVSDRNAIALELHLDDARLDALEAGKANLTPRVETDTSTNILTIDTSVIDQSILTDQAEDLSIAIPSGSPLEGQKLVIRLKDNGTPRTLTFNPIFRPLGSTIPTTTVISKTVYIACIYNTTDTKWDVVSVAQEV